MNCVQQHRDGLIPGFTLEWGCKMLVWFELHGDVSEAIAREKAIKRWRRSWKFELIERVNPDWKDLWPALTAVEPYPWENAFGIDRDQSGQSPGPFFDPERRGR